MSKQTVEEGYQSYAETMALAERVNVENPNQADIKAFRKKIKHHPEIWRECGNAMAQALAHYMANVKATMLGKEATSLYLDELQSSLCELGTPLEKLLVEQVVLAWARLSTLEQQYTSIMNESHSLTFGIYWEKRLNAAHKRYERACLALAKVKKLLRPSVALQVNVANDGGQQINLLGEKNNAK